MAFEVGAVHDVPPKNAIAETWSEPLDLVLYGAGQVAEGTARDVTIRPRDVLAFRRT